MIDISMSTIKDVAKKADVGIGTVSRFLNNGSVAELTRLRIEEAIEELGFRPNAMARGMRAGATGLVGCLVSDLSSPLYGAVIRTLETALRERGLILVLANSHADVELELRVATQFVERRLEGMVFAPVQELGSKVMEMLKRADMPVVTLDRLTDDRTDCVLIDHRQGVHMATRHLLDLGHRRIALLTLGTALRSEQGRVQGFRDAFTEFGGSVDEELIRHDGTSVDAAFSTTLSLFEDPAPPTAIVCMGTRMLGGVLRAIRHTGRVIPSEVSVVSLGDSDLARYGDPAISTVRWDADEIGTLTARVLLDRLSPDKPARQRKVLVTNELVLRDSTARISSTYDRRHRTGAPPLPSMPMEKKR